MALQIIGDVMSKSAQVRGKTLFGIGLAFSMFSTNYTMLISLAFSMFSTNYTMLILHETQIRIHLTAISIHQFRDEVNSPWFSFYY